MKTNLKQMKSIRSLWKTPSLRNVACSLTFGLAEEERETVLPDDVTEQRQLNESVQHSNFLILRYNIFFRLVVEGREENASAVQCHVCAGYPELAARPPEGAASLSLRLTTQTQSAHHKTLSALLAAGTRSFLGSFPEEIKCRI